MSEMQTVGQRFPDEVIHLAMIEKRLEQALCQARAGVEQLDQEYREAKRYMADYRGEIDPHEMFQNHLALSQIDHTGAFAAGLWEKLNKLVDSPYFARIDFQSGETKTEAMHYIGRFAFHHENELLVYDWRAPIAGMFYDCEVGPAGYDAPIGRIEGFLTRKRQFKVKNATLEYAIESSMQIQDDVLQRELSQNSDEKMKSIIATIQKEQNQIIRNEKAQTLILQGVAGSGKTSIALHRIAYLLYRFRDTLTSNQVIILSPNRVFGDYISTVLPELGEEPILTLGIDELAETRLKGIIAFLPEEDFLETEDETYHERARFKSTSKFLEQLDAFLKEAPALLLEPIDVTIGRLTLSADWIFSRFCAQSEPFEKRLEQIAQEIHSRLSADPLEDEIPKKTNILKRLRAMLRVKNGLSLYQAFYRWLGRPELLVLPDKHTLEWTDVFPFYYLHAAFAGLQQDRSISHLVIDEMQDYTPVQYAVINRLFPCPKTILGDFGQRVNPNHRQSLADLQQQYPTASVVKLNKSYRSTYEIIRFAKEILPLNHIEPIKRRGEAPLLISCGDQEDVLRTIQSLIDAFSKRKGGSLGIILKTNRAAQNLHAQLSKVYDVQLISPDSTRFSNGITVASVLMSKGLEFDEVILPDASDITYQSEADQSLLYVAATRAMHRLTLLYRGAPSRFLPK